MSFSSAVEYVCDIQRSLEPYVVLVFRLCHLVWVKRMMPRPLGVGSGGGTGNGDLVAATVRHFFFLKNSGGSYLTFEILCVYVLSGTCDLKIRIWSSRKKMGQQKVVGDTKGTCKVLGDTKSVKWFSKWQICASIESKTHYLIHIL